MTVATLTDFLLARIAEDEAQIGWLTIDSREAPLDRGSWPDGSDLIAISPARLKASGARALGRCALERDADFLDGCTLDANCAGLAAVAALAVLDIHPAAALRAFGFGQRSQRPFGGAPGGRFPCRLRRHRPGDCRNQREQERSLQCEPVCWQSLQTFTMVTSSCRP